ncbi:MAG: hypothetical protein AABY22_08070, partial [Nanoarchaeota archaeon]
MNANDVRLYEVITKSCGGINLTIDLQGKDFTLYDDGLVLGIFENFRDLANYAHGYQAGFLKYKNVL